MEHQVIDSGDDRKRERTWVPQGPEREEATDIDREETPVAIETQST